jgi:AhpD family alkylhydroperoxidase
MDEKTRILISLGVSAAANSIPCFEHHHDKALKTGLTDGEIKEAVEVAMQVKNGAHLTTRKFIEQAWRVKRRLPVPSVHQVPRVVSGCERGEHGFPGSIRSTS